MCGCFLKEESLDISIQPQQTQRPGPVDKEISVPGFLCVWCSCECLWCVWEAEEGGVPLRAPWASTAGTVFMASAAQTGPRATDSQISSHVDP